MESDEEKNRQNNEHRYEFYTKDRIPLGDGFFVIIDPALYDYLIQFNWYPKKGQSQYYACRKQNTDKGPIIIRMHRVVAMTPKGMVTHHKNFNTMDNRRSNLKNMTPTAHDRFHSNNHVRIKYDDTCKVRAGIV